MIVGFSGTREGMRLRQYWSLLDWLNEQQPTRVEHGCCIGADAEFSTTVIRGGIGASDIRRWAAIVAHPSTLMGMTDANALATADIVCKARSPLDRNRDIVIACDVLLAAPKATEELRSGTWATVRAAKKLGKPVVIFYPDGRVEGPKEGSIS